MFGLGIGEILLVGGALMLLFGARKIPMLARGLGESIRNFKGELREGASPESDEQEPPALEDGNERER